MKSIDGRDLKTDQLTNFNVLDNRNPQEPVARCPSDPRSRHLPSRGLPGVPEPEYPRHMVNPALQSAIEAMSLDERLELVEYIESTVDVAAIDVTEDQKAMIRARAAELRADPSIGLTWDELDARTGSRWA